jgi:hypothetical protein
LLAKLVMALIAVLITVLFVNVTRLPGSRKSLVKLAVSLVRNSRSRTIGGDRSREKSKHNRVESSSPHSRGCAECIEVAPNVVHVP